MITDDKFNYKYIYEYNNAIVGQNNFEPYYFGFIKPFHPVDSFSLVNTLQEGLSRIATEISKSGNDSLADGIWLALIGALSAFLFNFVQKMIERSSQRLTKSGEATLILIKELEVTSIGYWLKGYVASDKDKLTLDEVNIKAMLITLRANILTIIDNLPYKEKKTLSTKLRDFSSEIYDLTSGGDFESVNRNPDKRRVSSIARKCSDVKALILKLI